MIVRPKIKFYIIVLEFNSLRRFRVHEFTAIMEQLSSYLPPFEGLLPKWLLLVHHSSTTLIS